MSNEQKVNELNEKKPFRKLYVEKNELYKLMRRDPLLWTVFTECALRARRTLDNSPDGLKQFEFWLAETECEKFGLKRTQSGQLRRKILKLNRLMAIEKTKRRIENSRGVIYRFISNEIIDINPEIENKIENEKEKNREPIEINKNDKKTAKQTTAVKKLKKLLGNEIQIKSGFVYRVSVDGRLSRIKKPVAYLKAIEKERRALKALEEKEKEAVDPKTPEGRRRIWAELRKASDGVISRGKR